jgi:hypothetical protein
LHLKVIDLATNPSSQVDSNTVTYDTSTITGTLTIEGGAVSTLSSEVSLTLGTNKPSVKSSSYYYINNDLDAVVDQTASGSGWTAWPADDVITGWSLGIVDPTAYGFKFVYMRLKDPSSNVSDVVTASIYYGEVGLGAQTFLVTLESNYPAGPGINTLAMPFAAPWYVFNSSGTALLYDGVTNEVRTAYDLVQAVNAAAGTGSNVVSTFGKWDPTGQYANGVLIGTSIDGDEATRLAAISLEQGKGYQVYMRQNNVQMMIKNVAE